MQPKKAPEPKRSYSIKPHLLSWAVFIPTLVVVFISLIPVVFPALLSRTTSSFQDSVFSPNVIDPFQPGALAAPLIIINIIVLVIGFAYYKRAKCQTRFRAIANFELTKKQALIGVIAVLAIFCILVSGTLASEETWADYTSVKKRVDSWDISQFGKSFEPHFRYLLLSTSLHLFGNMRVIPLIASAALLLLTYFFTKNITEKRFAGLVSMVLVLQSNIFVSYSTTATYDNFWILLYLFSLYLIQKFWQPSVVPYFLSLFSKPLTLAFLPMSLYFIARSALPKKTKIYSLAAYGAIIVVIAAIAVSYSTNFAGGTKPYDNLQFWQGFASMAMQMRFDYIAVLFMLPLTVMLFFASRKGILHADSVLIFIFVTLLTSPFLTGFTLQTNQPYRYVSLVVFFAIGVGILLSKKTRKAPELSSNT